MSIFNIVPLRVQYKNMNLPHPREHALQLRLKGHSYNEISKTLNVSKSTLSLWLRDVVLSEGARQRLSRRVRQGVLNGLIKRNKMQTHTARVRARQIRLTASSRIKEITSADLLLIGAILYWAEGYKRPLTRHGRELTSHAISFVNSDPEMVRLFVLFLQKTLHVESRDVIVCMRLYAHINEEEARRYWLNITGLLPSNMRRSTFLTTGASKGKRPYNRLPYGTVQIAVYDTKKFNELMGLIDGVKKKALHDILAQLPG